MKTIILAVILISLNSYADRSALCDQVFKDSVQFSKRIQPPTSVDHLTIITWNAHKYADQNFFWDLKKLSAQADILMVQEAVHSTNWQAAFASYLPFSFSFFKSFCTRDDKATGVQTAARYLLKDNKNIISMDTEPVSFTPKVTGLSRIEVPGHGQVLLVNTHALNFNLGELFKRQIDQVVAYLATEKGPIIWAGDFNTWDSSRKAYLNKKTKSLGLIHVVPNHDDRNLILDHIYIRGFEVISADVLNEKSSDHQPVQAVLRFKKI